MNALKKVVSAYAVSQTGDNLHLVFRSKQRGDHKLHIATSRDEGRTFSDNLLSPMIVSASGQHVR